MTNKPEWMVEKPCTQECLSHWGGKCTENKGHCDSFQDYLKLVEAQTKLLEYLIAHTQYIPHFVVDKRQVIPKIQLESMLKQIKENRK